MQNTYVAMYIYPNIWCRCRYGTRFASRKSHTIFLRRISAPRFTNRSAAMILWQLQADRKISIIKLANKIYVFIFKSRTRLTRFHFISLDTFSNQIHFRRLWPVHIRLTSMPNLETILIMALILVCKRPFLGQNRDVTA